MRKRRKKKKRFAIFVCVLILALMLLVRGLVLAADVLGIMQASGPHTLAVSPADANLERVSVILKEAKVIQSPFLFRLIAQMKGVEDAFYASTFTFDRGSGYNRIINTLTYDSGYRTTNVTIPEGATVQDVQRIVVQTGYVTDKEFEAALKKAYAYDFLPAHISPSRKNSLEGYLFPDTYNISNTMSAEEIIDMILRRFDEIYTKKYSARAEALGYTDDEIIILASIIEAEAGSGNDRAKVSSVFHNRLNHPQVYPYLQSCATVQYILGEKKLILSMEDTKINSPYNTYIKKGLPIGPICNPGKAAIEAALYPANTQYYYFQSDAKGKLYYAKTMQEHEQMKIEIQGD